MLKGLMGSRDGLSAKLLVGMLVLYLNTGYTESAADNRIVKSIPETFDAETDGTVTVLVKEISLQEFAGMRFFFQEIVARYSSMHCQKHSDNCNTAASNFSPYDVIVTSEKEEALADVEVKLHIHESGDSTVAALTSEQLADVFYEFEELIEKSFGYKVELVDPTRSDNWEAWRIAVVVIISVIIVVLIVFAIWLAHDSNKNYKAMERVKQIQHVKRLSAYENLRLEDDVDKHVAYEFLRDDGSNVSDGPPSHRTTMTTTTDVPYDNVMTAPNVTTFQGAAVTVYDNKAVTTAADDDDVAGDDAGHGAEAEEEEEDYFELTSL